MPRGPANPPGPLAREFTEAVREHMNQRGVSGLELAKRIGISQNYVAKRLRHETPFTFNDIENIATALQIPVADLVPGMGEQRGTIHPPDRAGRLDTDGASSGRNAPAVVSMAGPHSSPAPDTALEGTLRMSVRIDELFENLPPVLTVTDLTRILGKDRTTVYRWLKKGEVPGVLIDTTWIIYRDEVRDYLLSRHNQAGGAPQASPPDEDSEPQDGSSSA
jgi:transcriptional regulator with XRE-family HTH domain